MKIPWMTEIWLVVPAQLEDYNYPLLPGEAGYWRRAREFEQIYPSNKHIAVHVLAFISFRWDFYSWATFQRIICQPLARQWIG